SQALRSQSPQVGRTGLRRCAFVEQLDRVVMKVVRVLLLLTLALVASEPAHAITPEKVEFKKVADDIYAFIGKRNDANALVIVTSQGAVVVDTGNNPPETRLLQNFIRSVTSQPIRYVIITQNHGDHAGGTPHFAPP